MILIKGVLELRHSIHTRLRFKAFPIRYNRVKSEMLEKFVSQIPGVIRYKTNIKSASLIIRYNPGEISKNDLAQQISNYSGFVKTAKNNGMGSESVSYHAKRFAGLSIVTASVFIREVIFKIPVAQGLFSPLGLITSIAAIPLFKSTFKQIKEKRLTLESFLGGSIIAACAAGEAAAALEILWITSGGELLQTWITERSRRSIREILDLTSKNTFILIDGVEIEVPVDQVKKGDIVVLHTGEKISVDGKIVDGEAVVDESPVTGRSEHVLRKEKDSVFAGTFVRQGVIYVKAEKVGDKTYLSRIFTMVEDSLENKAEIEGVADRLAANLIKTGFAVTAGTFFLTGSLWRAFTVMLVMACPCATILSASTAISAAISAAARRHILIKGGRYLEESGKADIVCFDKTGTLTTNEPELHEIINFSDMSENEILRLVCSAEMHNLHPVALAVKKEAAKRNLTAVSHDVCDYILGRGVRAVIKGREIIVGSSKMMERFKIDISEASADIEALRKEGLTIIFVSDSGKLSGILGFANKERDGIYEVVEYLTGNGVKKVIMITGDEECTATSLASRLNISQCHHSVLPENKADIINELKQGNNKVLMVGDGINDALALAEGDIGVAMGAGGSEVAIEAADIALVNDDINGIIYIHGLSRKTMSIIYQNFWIATGSNIVGVILGAAGLLSPVAAGLIHITHTLGILLNSGRLLGYDTEKKND
ncbi:MAG: heavy metal translocating P-type ATPase [Deltaproteobacteria bacterium]|nr:MAG: heavy metal translocating P-type ATPase [Deltaproteobacteria bacterium]